MSVAGKTINGFNFTFELVHNTANTSFSGQILNLLNTTITVELKRFGNSYTLLSDTLLQLVMDSTLRGPLFKFCTGSQYITTVAAAAGVYQQVIIPTFLDLGGPINLIGDDSIEVTYYMPSSAAASTVNTSASSCELVENEVSGVETYTPYILTRTIDAALSSYNNGFKDKISQISFINLDKTAVTTSSMVVSNSVINSNRVGLSDSYNQLMLKRQNMIFSESNPDTRYQSFILLPYSGIFHNGAKLNLNLTASNVNASQNYVVVRSVFTDARLMEQAKVNMQNYRASLAQ